MSKWLVLTEPQTGIYTVAGLYTVDDAAYDPADPDFVNKLAQDAATQAANEHQDQSAFYPIDFDDRRPYRVSSRQAVVYFDAVRSIPTPVRPPLVIE